MPGIEPCEWPNGSDQREPTHGATEPFGVNRIDDIDWERDYLGQWSDDRVDAASYAVSALNTDTGSVTVRDVFQLDERIWQYNDQVDEFERRLRLYASPIRPVWNGVFSIPEYPQLGRLAEGWVKFWENLGIAHTAAVFMLPTSWDPKEQKFDNANAIRAAIGL